MPEIEELTDGEWRQCCAIVEHALSSRPPAVRRQLALFVSILQLLSLLKYRRSITRFQPAMRAQFLEAIQDSRLLLFRRGFWGLRTLILMGYYARPEARARIGYRASARGWQARA